MLAGLAVPAVAAAGRADFLPPGNRLFPAPVADPALPAVALRLLGLIDGHTRSEINLGEEFGVLSRGGGRYQLGVAAGIAARFELMRDLRILEVADYTLAVPFDVDFGRFVLRAAYLHTSSHLGDDYIHHTGATTFKRINNEIRCTFSLPLEAAATPARLYAGAGYAFNVLPKGSGRARLLGGAEIRRAAPALRGALFAAADLQVLERSDWRPALTTRAGWLAAGAAASISVFLEYFSGPLPYLAFIERTESHWALGVALRR